LQPTAAAPPQQPSQLCRCKRIPPGDSRAIQRIQGIRAYPQIAHDHGSVSISGSEAAHRATIERNLRINACTGLHCGATPPPIATAKGQTRRPGARNRCVGDPAKEKKRPRNSFLSDRSREYSACERAGMYGARAHRKLASAQLTRSSNAQHRTDFKSKRAQDCLCLCCPRCFCFRRPCAGTLCPPSRWAAAQVPPLLAPLSPPASSSSTHTHNTQVPVSSMPHPTARATIPRFARALFAASASPSTPAAGTQCAAARSPSALEGPVTRATYSYQLLLCPGRTARTPLRIAARALLALRSVRHMLPPPFPPFYSSNVSRPRAPSHNKRLVVFLFLFFVMLWLRMLFTRSHRGFTGICELRFEHEMLLHREMLGGFAHMFAAKEQNLNFILFLLGVMLQLCHN